MEYLYFTISEVMEWQRLQCGQSSMKMSGKFFRRPDDIPADVEFPVWVSFRQDATMLPEKGRVILELEIEESLITRVNFTKWGMILNYSYIPADKADEKRHKELLEAYGVSDTQAYMSQFYPEIKREIRESWKRLFDDDIQIGSDGCYGNIWEVRREWVKNVIQ